MTLWAAHLLNNRISTGNTSTLFICRDTTSYLRDRCNSQSFFLPRIKNEIVDLHLRQSGQKGTNACKNRRIWFFWVVSFPQSSRFNLPQRAELTGLQFCARARRVTSHKCQRVVRPRSDRGSTLDQYQRSDVDHLSALSCKILAEDRFHHVTYNEETTCFGELSGRTMVPRGNRTLRRYVCNGCTAHPLLLTIISQGKYKEVPTNVCFESLTKGTGRKMTTTRELGRLFRENMTKWGLTPGKKFGGRAAERCFRLLAVLAAGWWLWWGPDASWWPGGVLMGVQLSMGQLWWGRHLKSIVRINAHLSVTKRGTQPSTTVL